ncbi:MAG: hypothetical protein EXR75_01905 [Myxococcales bacterium]|nr:hypothetical protein [Myxococcales bacterium]
MTAHRRSLPVAWAVIGALFAFAPSARAAPPSTPAPAAGKKAWASCAEYIPDGAARPGLESELADRAMSGHETRFKVIVTHGRGERVLPAGFRVERGSDAMRAIEAAGFRVPDPKGGSPAVIERPSSADLEDESKRTVVTTLTLPLLVLPEKPGRHELELPPLPIAVGRANGQVMTLCTKPRRLLVDEPIANEAAPAVRPNAPPRPQREEWLLARHATYAVLLVVLLAALGAWLLARYARRPKPVPLAPVVPAWVTALRELEAIRAAGLIDAGQVDELVDRVSTCVRRYLGERYGFDGAESTTEELRATLRRLHSAVALRPLIDTFLDETDLVKFAKVTPGPDDCEEFLARAETMVRTTTPHAVENITSSERNAA